MAALAVLGAIGGVLGGAATLISTRERVRALQQQGLEADLAADLEQINAQTTENDLRANLMRTLAASSAAVGASGLAAGSPTAEAALSDDYDVFGRQLRAVDTESLFRTAALRRSARNLRRQGKYAAITGLLSGFSQMAGGAGDLYGGGSAGGGGGGLTSFSNNAGSGTHVSGGGVTGYNRSSFGR